jgi:glycosyltransferase involved in cell wall biosynthesis
MNDPKPITIVHIITSLGVGGAERVLSNLVMSMDRDQFHNVVVSLQDLGYWGPILQQHGIEVHALHMQPNPTAINKLFKLWRLLRQIKPDYVQGWMYHANVMSLVIGKLAGVKHVLWNIRCSLMDLSKYKFSTRLMFRSGAWLARFPTAIINNSRVSIQQHISSGYKNKNIIYIPNGFDVGHFKPNNELYSAFRTRYRLPPHAVVIGMIARFDPMKDHATFLKAAGLLAHKMEDVYFVCAGRNVNWANQELKIIISEYNIQNRVMLLDQVDNVQELYPALDYLCQTSIYGEGFPNVVAEAMACGVECFVTDVGDSLEVIGNNGYQIVKQNPEALAVDWHKVITARNDNAHSVPARSRIIEEFSLPKIVEYYSAYYQMSRKT